MMNVASPHSLSQPGAEAGWRHRVVETLLSIFRQGDTKESVKQSIYSRVSWFGRYRLWPCVYTSFLCWVGWLIGGSVWGGCAVRVRYQVALHLTEQLPVWWPSGEWMVTQREALQACLDRAFRGWLRPTLFPTPFPHDGLFGYRVKLRERWNTRLSR